MKTRWLVIVATALALGFGGSANAAGDVAAGKAKAAMCLGCHGADGKGTKNGLPLADLSESDIAQALEDYKSGTRAVAVWYRSCHEVAAKPCLEGSAVIDNASAVTA